MRRLSCEHILNMLSKDVVFAHRIQLGDVVEVELADCFGGFPGRPQREFECANPVTGPIGIEGAVPGDTIAVEIRRVEVVGNGFVGTRGEPIELPVDARAGTVQYGPNMQLPLAPCVGTIGVAPAGEGVETRYAGEHGGNLDCNIIGPGATVCFTVWVPEAGLGMGDVHAVMGDGELSGQGVEIAAVATIRVSKVLGLGVRLPYGVRDERFFIASWGKDFREASDRVEAGMVRVLIDAIGLCEDLARRFLGIGTSIRVGWLTGATPTAWLELPLAYLPMTSRVELLNAVGVSPP